MDNRFDINDWKRVPERVSALLPLAAQVKAAHITAAEAAGLLAVSAAIWRPETNSVSVLVASPLSEKAAEAYTKKFAYSAQTLDFKPMAAHTPNHAADVPVSRGSLIPGTGAVWNTANSMLGGPNPLTNGIVASLLLGGLGYGAGTLAENLFPERYIERGHLRRTLGMLGALGGAGIGAGNAYANARAMGPGTSWLQGLVISNKTIPPYAQEKQSFDFTPDPNFPSSSGLFAPKVPVPKFNDMVWHDVAKGMQNPYGIHTDPQIGAATTGLMSGIASQARSPIISPATVINGIASAGVGLATANLAGRALSALAGLTPEAQDKLQDMGLYGGMLHAIVPSIFGLR